MRRGQGRWRGLGLRHQPHAGHGGQALPLPGGEMVNGMIMSSTETLAADWAAGIVCCSSQESICVAVDLRQEEMKAQLRYYNRAARGEYPPSQPTCTGRES